MAEQNLIFNIKNADGTSFHDISIKSSTYSETVMSLDKNIEGYFYYPDNKLTFTFKEYITYNGVNYLLKIDEPPTIALKGLLEDNGEAKGMTKYTIKFFNPTVLLYNIPFTDVAVSTNESKFKSEDTTFSWIGTLTQFVEKINKNLVGTPFTCQLQPNYVESGTQSDVLSFDNQMISDVLKTAYETWKVPFVDDGYNILFGKPSNEIYKDGETTPYIFKLGQGLGLKDNDRTPKNNTIITRIAIYGSDTNIPNGYPKIPWTGNQTWNYTINNDANLPNSYQIIDSVINGVSTRVINHPFTRKYLMPTVYVDSVNNKVNPLAAGYNPNTEIIDYYDAVNDATHTYPNQINTNSPSYQKHQLEKIKPSIVGAKYNNQEIDVLKTVSWINDDGTDATSIDDGYNSTTGKYNQGYFKVSFYPLGFDLYAMAAVTSAMSVNPTSGNCNGCKFELGVDWDVVKTNFYYTKSDGTVVFDPTNIYGNHRDYTKFPDSTNQSISVILKKDTSTFGTLMPNVYQQPIIGDKFVFIGIDLPQYYITQAQTNLDEGGKEYMLENNIQYFEYPFTFDEYFLTENQDVLSQIKTNSILRFEYAGENLALSIKEFTIQWGQKALPIYKITLTDDVTISLNQLGQVTEGLSQLGSQVAAIQATYDINITDELNKRVSKIYDDTVNGKITFKDDISVGGVLKVSTVSNGKIPYNTINGLSDSPLYTDNTNVTSSVNVTAPTFTGELIGNAATATKLQTPRSIFGQTYDGTSDVTGASYHTLTGRAIYLGSNNQHSLGSNSAGNMYIVSGGEFFISAAGSTRMYINSVGNLGVGTIAPAYKLDVNGNARIASDLYTDSTVGTSNFISHTMGWRADANGNADFRNIYSDELRVQAFTADISQALAGSDYLTKSVSKLSANFVVPSVNSTVRIIVDDIEGMPATQCFANNDYIRFRAFNRTSGLTIANVWGTVTLDTTFGTNGFSNGTQAYTFTCTQTSGAGLTVFKGSEVLDYGTSGSGLIARTTLDAQGSPYEQIATWINDPSISTNYTVHARLGNLNGIANCSGYGVYTDNGFFTGKITVGDLTKSNHYLDFANGALTVKGNVYLSSGDSAVGSNGIISAINLTSETATIQASKINLVGAVTFNSFTTDVQNTINGKTDSASHGNFTYIDGNSVYTGALTAGQVNAVAINASSITTGTLSADRIAANSLDASKIVANSITSTQINATSVSIAIASVISLDASRITTGTLGANRIDSVSVVANGIAAQTINAQNATFENLNVVNATMHNGTIYNLRSPWISAADDLTSIATDNSIMTNGSGSGYQLFTLDWTVASSGRSIQLISRGSTTIGAANNMWFYVNGNRVKNIYLTDEIVELVGYGGTTLFFGWIVKKRTPLMGYQQYGKPLNILSHGIVTVPSSTSISMSYKMFNGGYIDGTLYTMSVSRQSEGLYRVSFPTQWGLGTNYMVITTGYGQVIFGTENNHPSKATIKTIGDGYFDVWVSDDSSVNDGSFAFQMFNMNDI